MSLYLKSDPANTKTPTLKKGQEYTPNPHDSAN